MYKCSSQADPETKGVFGRDLDSPRNVSVPDSLQKRFSTESESLCGTVWVARWILETRTRIKPNQVLGVSVEQYKNKNLFQVVLAKMFHYL